ncbi:carbon-nitrogen family hydrolase [Bacillus freudenreichii]|nr:carbon-nitrogen family hydrolase [Bacillus freudenreichii]
MPERGIRMLRKYKAASIQYNPTLHAKKENIQDLLKLSTEAAENGAKLIVMPEMATTGYCFYDRDEIKAYVEPVPGPTTFEFEKVASAYNCYIVIGLAEVDPETDIYYNTGVLIGPDGFIGKYRKTHHFVTETRYAKDGDLGFPVFDTEIGKIGCLICMDHYFFEPSRIMALQGVEVLCNPTNWNEEKSPAPCWFTRAWENGMYIISANRSDQERGNRFSGGSSILKPDGEILSYIDDGIGIIYGEVDLDQTKKKQTLSGINKLNDRQVGHYKSLNLNIYLNNPYYVHRLYAEDSLPEGKGSKISVFQFYPEPFNIERNLMKIKEGARSAAKNKSELLVLPEHSVTGNAVSHSDALNMAEDLNEGNLIKELSSIANKSNLNMVLSIVEKEKEKLFHTVVLINGNGLIGKYRKIHLNKVESKWATRGEDGFKFFDLPLGRVGLLSGDDSMFPESTMSLAVWGADVIAIPASVREPLPLPLQATKVPLLPERTILQDDPVHWHLWRTRAVETNTFVAFANQIGEGGMGYSGIFGPIDWPRQEVLLDSEEKAIHYQIDTTSQNDVYPDKLVRVKELVRMRYPHLYDRLLVKNPVSQELSQV